MSLINDICTLTTISEKSLNKIKNAVEIILAHDILEAYNNHEDCKIDIGFGTLIFNFIDDELVFKFIPSDNFKKLIITTTNNNISPICELAELNIDERILKTYKDFL